MSASNTKECFREVVGLTVKGVLFDALPASDHALAVGSKTLVFSDGTGLTISHNGSFWRESQESIQRALWPYRERLRLLQEDAQDVLALAGEAEAR